MNQEMPRNPDGKKRRRIPLSQLLSMAFFASIILALASGTSSRAGIRGSAHDFSPLTADEQICIFCHTPHNASTDVTDAPLWNHQVTSKQFQVYNSPTLDATVGQPSGASRLCLSCHDGTVAVDSFGGRAGTLFIGGSLGIGNDELANDHPVSFIYDDTLATEDGGLFPPSSTPSGLGRTIQRDLLFNDSLECSSCHDVHNGPVAASVNDSLLLITQAQSRLCLTCHNK